VINEAQCSLTRNPLVRQFNFEEVLSVKDDDVRIQPVAMA
jgi:hypothetical protein